MLEERYPHHDGLNLTFETREGILKHCSIRHARELERSEPGGVGRRFIDRTQPSLEAQVCNLADEIAYIFGQPLDDSYKYAEKDKKLSRTMMTFWANFAKTG